MKEYRITKYNPTYRVEGLYYAVDEWTSISDVGKKFNGTELSYDEYLQTEKAYIECCVEIMEQAGIKSLSVEQAEDYEDDIRFPASISCKDDIRQAISACLREQCWFKLTAAYFFIHFGYDYEMYVGSELPIEVVEAVATKHGLYCELHQSPYNDDVSAGGA